MSMRSHPVIEGLGRTLAKSRSKFISELESRLRQLIADMVDGVLLPKEQANALRAALIDFAGSDVLPKLGKYPEDGLRVLDKLKAYGFAQLEAQRPVLEAARAAQFAPPAAADWPEVVELARLAASDPNLCAMRAPVDNVYFAKELEDDGVPIPAELVALYAACDGFELSSRADPGLPVFSLLPSKSIDMTDEAEGFPRRAAVFQGEDEIQFSVYRDRTKQWWVVYEHEYEPIAKKQLDVRALVSFGIRRMNAGDAASLDGELSWETFFEVT